MFSRPAFPCLRGGQRGVEAGAHFQQGAHAPVDLRIAFRRLGDTGEDLQERGLPRTIAANDAHHLAALDLEGPRP